MRSPHPLSVLIAVFRKEVLEGLRNRRALFFAFGLPLFLYPALIVLFSMLEKQHFEIMERQVGRICVVSRGEGSLTSRIASWLEADEGFDVVRGDGLPELLGPIREALEDGGSIDTATIRSALLADSADVLLTVLADTSGRSSGLPTVGVVFMGEEEASFALVRRVTESLDSLRSEIFDARARYARLMNPWRDIVLVVHDSAIRTARSGRYLGSILPMLILFISLTGGSYIALDSVAGERERGTLESLLSQPVGRASIIGGKALAVICASLTAVLTSCVGLLISGALMPEGLLQGVELAIPETGAILEGFLASLPLVLQIAAALMIVTSLARSYKAAQNYLLPVTLLLLVAGMLVTSAEMEHTLTMALLPIAGQAFAFRELLAGTGDALMVAVSTACGLAYGGLGLWWAAGLLSGEGVLLKRSGGSRPRGISPARRAVGLGLLVLLGLYYFSGLLAEWEPLTGIAVTEWAFVLGASVAYMAIFGLGGPAVGIRRPSLRSVAVALLLVAPLSLAAFLVLQLQSVFLPLPEMLRQLLQPLEEAGTLETLLVLVITPAICEELLFRGVIMRQLAQEISQPRAILVTAILFGAFHMSIYRFLPTFVVGLVLGWICFASGSLIPSMLLHAAYNLAARYLLPEDPAAGMLLFIVMAIVSLLLAIMIIPRPWPVVGRGSRSG